MKNYKKLKDVGILILCDFVAITVSVLLSLLITYGTVDFCLSLLYWYLFNITAGYLFFALFRLYFIVFTSVGIIDTLKAVGAMVLILCSNIAYSLIFDSLIGIRVCFTFSIMLGVLALLIRFSKRIYVAVRYSFSRKNKNKVRAMIVGGGNAGTMLIREIQSTDKITYLPVCVIDDDQTKVGKSINNVKIVGKTDEIPSYAEKYGIDEILIAMPAAPKAEIKRVFDICEKTKCKVKTLPGIYQIVNGDASVTALREVQISDLLGRDQIKVNLDEIMGYIENRVVLVTGGGGSIGSELCRQIATHNPKQLIILDIYENNAYDIEQELK
ncbi:MAG: polysaccharide biosynthesis protein, partial [Clostridia bacterium]|nr:polysaccharide biosynthesis protein [Clostridia bacterium]